VNAVYVVTPVKRLRRTNTELDVLDTAIHEACATEHPVTLRGVFYRVVSAGAVEKSEAGYRVVGRQLLKLRRGRAIPYNWITDGTRLRLKPDSWSDLDQMLADAAESYRRALWDDQDVQIIVLSEKDAITGVVHPVTDAWDIELCIVRGFSSETFVHSIAETVIGNDKRGKTTFLYQLGDHDPSGVDAWRDFRDKVARFAPHAAVEFERLAVTPAQIERYRLPTRPTKRSDSRACGFEGESVEVDAIPPSELRAIVEEAITQHVDGDRLRLNDAIEAAERELLTSLRGKAT
jgi:hypothetical protein